MCSITTTSVTGAIRLMALRLKVGVVMGGRPTQGAAATGAKSTRPKAAEMT